VTFRQPVKGEILVTQNTGEQVVEVMGDAAGERAEGLHFLGLEQLALQLAPHFLRIAPGRDILKAAEESRHLTLVGLGLAQDADPQLVAAGRDEGQLQIEGRALVARPFEGLVEDDP
jgi:hypothetical protein